MAARSDFQTLKTYLSRYGEAQKREKRLADRLDRLDRDLGRHGAPDPQPGVALRETVQDFSSTPSPIQGTEPGNPECKDQNPGIGAKANAPDARGKRLPVEGGSFPSDPVPGADETLRDLGTGFPDSGEGPGKTGTGIRGRDIGSGYPEGIWRNRGQTPASHGPGPADAGEQGPDLNRHPLPPGGDRSGNFWRVERRAQCAKALADQRAATASARDGLVRALCLLPPDSERRYVLELRYLDSLSWGVVAEVAHMSRSSCFSKASAGIRELLGYSEVQEMIRGQ